MVKRNVGLIAGLIAAVALAVIGYSTYAAVQKRAQQRQVAALVGDTTEKLRQALAAKPAPELVAAIDANLRATRAPRDPALADAAEQYITSAREIARRRVESGRLEPLAAASRRALEGHMSAGRRSDAWFKEAIALKKRVENEHADLAATLKALDQILFTLPDVERRLAPRISAELLLEAKAIDAARSQAQAEVARVAQDLERMRRLTPSG